jgi:hypothetical protein
LQPHNAQRGLCRTGAATLPLFRVCEQLLPSAGPGTRAASVRHLHLTGDGPHKGRHFSCNCHHDLIDVLASGHQASVAFTEADLRFPPDLLNRRGYVFQPQLEVTADLGRVAIGPGTLNEDPACM